MFIKTRHYIKLLNAEEILRRYFIINSFDGVLTTVGVLIGAFVAGGLTNKEIILVTLAAALSMFISGVTGALLTEKAERERMIKDLEKAVLRKLNNSVFKKASKTVVFLTGLIDGFSPLLASLVVISPFFFINQPTCFFLAIPIAFILLFFLGSYLGKISKKNVLMSGLQMLSVGVLATLVLMLLKAF